MTLWFDCSPLDSPCPSLLPYLFPSFLPSFLSSLSLFPSFLPAGLMWVYLSSSLLRRTHQEGDLLSESEVLSQVSNSSLLFWFCPPEFDPWWDHNLKHLHCGSSRSSKVLITSARENQGPQGPLTSVWGRRQLPKHSFKALKWSPNLVEVFSHAI